MGRAYSCTSPDPGRRSSGDSPTGSPRVCRSDALTGLRGCNLKVRSTAPSIPKESELDRSTSAVVLCVLLAGCQAYTFLEQDHHENYRRVFAADPPEEVEVLNSVVVDYSWRPLVVTTDDWEFELLAPRWWIEEQLALKQASGGTSARHAGRQGFGASEVQSPSGPSRVSATGSCSRRACQKIVVYLPVLLRAAADRSIHAPASRVLLQQSAGPRSAA
jgi:hypothetical protein